jgi:hypothetical protein
VASVLPTVNRAGAEWHGNGGHQKQNGHGHAMPDLENHFRKLSRPMIC